MKQELRSKMEQVEKKIKDFTDLIAWQKGHELITEVRDPSDERFLGSASKWFITLTERRYARRRRITVNYCGFLQFEF